MEHLDVIICVSSLVMMIFVIVFAVVWGICDPTRYVIETDLLSVPVVAIDYDVETGYIEARQEDGTIFVVKFDEWYRITHTKRSELNDG